MGQGFLAELIGNYCLEHPTYDGKSGKPLKDNEYCMGCEHIRTLYLMRVTAFKVPPETLGLVE